jgi:hypothetical protein
MELTNFLGLLAAVLPLAYGAPTQAANTLHPEIVAAMKRDLGLDAEQANARVAREISAAEVIDSLRETVGDAFAGAWVSDDGQTINIGVTDESVSEEVTAAGATPSVVDNSFTKLEEAKAALDSLVNSEPKTLDFNSESSGIAAWYVDVVANKVVIEATADSISKAEDFAAKVGLSESEFEVQTVEELPVPYITVRGGDAYYIGGSSRCSIGFSVTTGFVTAGHCGRTGASATTSSGGALGTFAGSVFPGSADMAFVRTTSGHTLSGTINNYNGGTLPVSGSTAAPVGSSICRSGSTTGVYCGAVRSINTSISYPQGTVTGLTGTSVCAEPGDSGGSFYSGSQAQGVTSGGSGNCRTGGTTYFQPVNEILSTYGLTLVRS